LKENKLATRAF